MKKHLDLAQERRMDSCVILGTSLGHHLRKRADPACDPREKAGKQKEQSRVVTLPPRLNPSGL